MEVPSGYRYANSVEGKEKKGRIIEELSTGKYRVANYEGAYTYISERFFDDYGAAWHAIMDGKEPEEKKYEEPKYVPKRFTTFVEALLILRKIQRIDSIELDRLADAESIMMDIMERDDGKRIVALFLQRGITYPFKVLKKEISYNLMNKRHLEDVAYKGEGNIAVIREYVLDVLRTILKSVIDQNLPLEELDRIDEMSDEEVDELFINNPCIREGINANTLLNRVVSDSCSEDKDISKLKLDYLGDEESDTSGKLSPYILAYRKITKRKNSIAEQYFKENGVRDKWKNLLKIRREELEEILGYKNPEIGFSTSFQYGAFEWFTSNLNDAKIFNDILDLLIEERDQNTAVDGDLKEVYLQRIIEILNWPDNMKKSPINPNWSKYSIHCILEVIGFLSENGSYYVKELNSMLSKSENEEYKDDVSDISDWILRKEWDRKKNENPSTDAR